MTIRATALLAAIFAVTFVGTRIFLNNRPVRERMPKDSWLHARTDNPRSSASHIREPSNTPIANQRNIAIGPQSANTLVISSSQPSRATPNPLFVAGLQQSVPGQLEGCWEGILHNPDSCSFGPCIAVAVLFRWFPGSYEVCFRRTLGNLLRVEGAKGSYDCAGPLHVTGIEAQTILLHSSDVRPRGANCCLM
jgi:hypothetical protein